MKPMFCQVLTAEKLQQSKFVLHLDGTSRDKKKIVGHQVTLDNGDTLSLGYTDVATEDAATLLDVTISILRELGEIHDPDHQETIFREIISKLQCTVTDRASVMKKFCKDLNDTCQSTLSNNEEMTFLHCNAHFLLGLSSGCDGALKTVETGINFKLGFVRTACAILGPRGDQKSGCRVEWLAFCEERDISSKLPSYRSNRFNCFFEGAARLIQNLPTIREFLSGSYLDHENLLIDSVRKDSPDPKLMALVASMGFIHLHFTGPYWQLIRSKSKFTQFPQYVCALHESFKSCTDNPLQILNSSFKPNLLPTYGNVPDNDILMTSLYSFAATFTEEERKIFSTAFESLMRSSSDVLARQLGDFLKGGRLAEVPEALHHCLLTNLVGENTFGDFDFQKGKHRHASLFHHSSLHMAKHNNVSAWLKSRTQDEAASVMYNARKTAKSLRAKHHQREQEVMKAVRRKRVENAVAQQELEMKAAASRKKLIEDVLNHGGPCRSAGDVKALQSSLSGKELVFALKNEIRYQKIILGVPGVLKLSKPPTDLVADLCHHLIGPLEPENLDDIQDSFELNDEEDTAINFWQGTFEFQKVSSWVAVYYDDQFYIGQVTDIASPESAEIKFLEQTKANEEYLRWPRTNDIAIDDAKFVFAWDFDVPPVSSNCRLWTIVCLSALKLYYSRIKDGCISRV
ncbi:hypothetical protein PoB_005396600 [Plakobranchus ocellatus]|uniref:Uncharacterized protein n=1 Tax=Plakobranchus ocellatus TaxID=259542 RepID=A0AAV4BWB9_9GAST|nr:hypothetical protein PoB_005396600 [Plakobranchus ocellatus]